jgi:predicted transcriptional regulator
VPAVKALMAQQLVEEHGLRQDQVAEILGISQSAVSKYSRKTRGYAIRIDNIEEIRPLVSSMIVLLTSGTYQRTEFLRFFCQTCRAIRKTSLMCDFCQKSDPRIKTDECGFCDLPRTSKK